MISKIINIIKEIEKNKILSLGLYNYTVDDLIHFWSKNNEIYIHDYLYNIINKCIQKEPSNEISILFKNNLKVINKHYDNYVGIHISLFKDTNNIYNSCTLIKKENSLYIHYIDYNRILSKLESIADTKKDTYNELTSLYRVLWATPTKALTFKQYKVDVKIGKFIKSLFPNSKTSEIGKFIELIEAELVEEKEDLSFNIIEGNDISFYYNEVNYKQRTKTNIYNNDFANFVINVFGGCKREADTLNKSCMRGDQCGQATEFYAMFPDKIKLAILTDKDNKLRARCLLWYADDNKVYYDRIFYLSNDDFTLLSNKLIENKFINCSYSNNSVYESTVKVTLNKNLKTENLTFPYLDTMKYLLIEKDKTIISSKSVEKSVPYSTIQHNLRILNNNLFSSTTDIVISLKNEYVNLNNEFLVYDYDNKCFKKESECVYYEKESRYIPRVTNKIHVLEINKYINSNNILNETIIGNYLTLNTLINKEEQKHYTMSSYYGIYIPNGLAYYSKQYKSTLLNIISYNNENNKTNIHNKIKQEVKNLILNEKTI